MNKQLKKEACELVERAIDRKLTAMRTVVHDFLTAVETTPFDIPVTPESDVAMEELSASISGAKGRLARCNDATELCDTYYRYNDLVDDEIVEVIEEVEDLFSVYGDKDVPESLIKHHGKMLETFTQELDSYYKFLLSLGVQF